MKKVNLLIVAFILMLICYSCSKSDPYVDPQLPELTTEGLGTFGCLVNGEVWLPDSDTNGPFTPELDASFDEASGGLQIFARHRDSDKNIYESIHVNVTLDSNGAVSTFSTDHNVMTKGNHIHCFYYYPKIEETHIDITKIDVDQDIVSGTFAYGWVYNECGDSIHITDGRFDVKYHY